MPRNKFFMTSISSSWSSEVVVAGKLVPIGKIILEQNQGYTLMSQYDTYGVSNHHN